MKKLFGKVKYKNSGHDTDIYAPNKITGKMQYFGSCHLASIPYLKEDFKKYSYLITVVDKRRTK